MLIGHVNGICIAMRSDLFAHSTCLFQLVKGLETGSDSIITNHRGGSGRTLIPAVDCNALIPRHCCGTHYRKSMGGATPKPSRETAKNFFEGRTDARCTHHNPQITNACSRFLVEYPSCGVRLIVASRLVQLPNRMYSTPPSRPLCLVLLISKDSNTNNISQKVRIQNLIGCHTSGKVTKGPGRVLYTAGYAHWWLSPASPVVVRIDGARAKIAKIAKIAPKTIHFMDLLKSSPLIKFWEMRNIERDT